MSIFWIPLKLRHICCYYIYFINIQFLIWFLTLFISNLDFDLILILDFWFLIFILFRDASKKAGSSTRNRCRNTPGKRRGIKVYDGQRVPSGWVKYFLNRAAGAGFQLVPFASFSHQGWQRYPYFSK